MLRLGLVFVEFGGQLLLSGALLAQARSWSESMGVELERALASGADTAPPAPLTPDPGPVRTVEAKAYLAFKPRLLLLESLARISRPSVADS